VQLLKNNAIELPTWARALLIALTLAVGGEGVLGGAEIFRERLEEQGTRASFQAMDVREQQDERTQASLLTDITFTARC
jgi:hypothetical protein